MPEDPPDPSERDELRRLLDGYAAPGRVRRLQDRQQPRRRGWLRRLGQALVATVLPRQQAPLTVALVRNCGSSLRGESPTRHAGRRVVWVNGPSRSRTVMPPSHPPASRYRRPALLLSRPPTPGGSLWPDPGAYDGPRRSLRHTGGAGHGGAWPVGLGAWWAGCGAAGVITSPFLAVRGRCAQLLPFSAVAVAATSKLLHLIDARPGGRVCQHPAGHRPGDHRPGQPPPIQPPIRSPILPPS